MDSVGHDGLNRMLDGFEDRTAEAVCTFAFCRAPGAEPILFQGRTEVGIASINQSSYVSFTTWSRGLLTQLIGCHCTAPRPYQLW